MLGSASNRCWHIKGAFITRFYRKSDGRFQARILLLSKEKGDEHAGVRRREKAVG